MAEQTMVEIVVAALVGFDLNDQLPDYNETLRKAARAAMEAMRKPTEEMLEILRKQGGIEGYQAMIDAALKE